MVTLPVPTVCLLLGEGAGGGALALLPADRVVAAQHGWVAPLPPEGASEILYRTATALQSSPPPRGSDRPTLPRQGSSTGLSPSVPTPPRSPWILARLSSALEYELTSLIHRDKSERLNARYLRYPNLGLHPEQ